MEVENSYIQQPLFLLLFVSSFIIQWTKNRTAKCITVLLCMFEARSVNVKKHAHTHTRLWTYSGSVYGITKLAGEFVFELSIKRTLV